MKKVEENYIPNDEPLLKVEKKLDKVQEKFEENTLALEMLRELKSQSKRKDAIIIILIGVILAMIIGFFVYEGQFETITEETTVDSGDNGIATYLENSNTGDINYGENN